jgi:hypothetical protein
MKNVQHVFYGLSKERSIIASRFERTVAS